MSMVDLDKNMFDENCRSCDPKLLGIFKSNWFTKTLRNDGRTNLGLPSARIRDSPLQA